MKVINKETITRKVTYDASNRISEETITKVLETEDYSVKTGIPAKKKEAGK